jgi:hypothetical protein
MSTPRRKIVVRTIQKMQRFSSALYHATVVTEDADAGKGGAVGKLPPLQHFGVIFLLWAERGVELGRRGGHVYRGSTEIKREREGERTPARGV